MGFALWHAGGDRFDRCTLVADGDGWALQGEARLGSTLVGYRLDLDAGWAVRALEVRAAVDRFVRAERDGSGSWAVDGSPRPDLAGCVDVQLDFTPAALTPLARRLDLPIGCERAVDAAHLRLDDLTLAPDRVALRHASASRWEHHVDGRTWAVHLGPAGLVQEHEAGWTAVALG